MNIRNTKLTRKQVVAIKKLIAQGVVQSAIAAQFDVSRSCISDIATERIWNEVPWPRGYAISGRRQQPLIDRVLQLIRKAPCTDKELRAIVQASAKEIAEVINDLISDGMLIVKRSGKWCLDKVPVSGETRYVYESDKNGEYLFGFLGDSHLASKYARLDVLNDLYDKFRAAGVSRVFHTGNWIDGEARFNMHDLLVHGMDQQIDYLVKNYPAGIPTYAVAGDDHEGWYCFEKCTEILTLERGWVKLERLTGQEHVATKTPAGEFEWQVPLKVIRKPHVGDMVRLKHCSLNIAVTPDHRFEVLVKPSMHGKPTIRTMTAAEIINEFKPRCYGIPRTTSSWSGNDIGEIDISLQPCHYKNHKRIWHPGKVKAHDLAVLCAWYVTEGWTGPSLTSIGQRRGVNDENRLLIIQAIERLGGRPRVYPDEICVSGRDLAEWLRENCGSGWANKRLPRWVLDMPSETLEQVFYAMIRGDGHDRGEGSGWKFYTGSEHLQAQMAEIAQKLGLTVSYAPGKGCINVHIGEMYQTAYLFERPKIEKYAGDVFCVSVPNERIFVRKNGKTLWSMNCQREGLDIGKHAERIMREAGREDWHNLGYMEAFVSLRHRKTSRTSQLLVMHPGVGSAYSVSYRPQKIVESFSGGSKPAVLLIGHYHKLSQNLIRNVWALQTGTQQDQTPFMRKKGIDAHVGGGICRLKQDMHGAIVACQVEFFSYFDRGYYNNRWNYAGPVTLPARKTRP